MPALVMFVAEARLRIMSGNMSPGGRTCKDFIFVCLYFSGRCVYKGIVSLSCLCWCIITSNVTLIKTWMRYFFCAIVRSCHSIMSPWMFKSCTKFILNFSSTHSLAWSTTYHIQESHLMTNLCSVRRRNCGNTKQHEGGLERLTGEFQVRFLEVSSAHDYMNWIYSAYIIFKNLWSPAVVRSRTRSGGDAEFIIASRAVQTYDYDAESLIRVFLKEELLRKEEKPTTNRIGCSHPLGHWVDLHKRLLAHLFRGGLDQNWKVTEA